MSRAPFRVLPALLLLVALVAGVRTVQSSRMVLKGSGGRALSAERKAVLAEEAGEKALLARVTRGDSVLAVLGAGRVGPDPFRPRAASPPPGGWKPAPKDTVVTVELPAVVLSAIDAARPEVILRVGDRVSGRLARGETWEGWTVVRIDKTGVELTGYERTLVLPAPNQGLLGGES